MMSRDDFRKYAAGSCITINPTVKIEDIKTYIDGAMMAYDYIIKNQTKENKESNKMDTSTFTLESNYQK